MPPDGVRGTSLSFANRYALSTTEKFTSSTASIAPDGSGALGLEKLEETLPTDQCILNADRPFAAVGPVHECYVVVREDDA